MDYITMMSSSFRPVDDDVGTWKYYAHPETSCYSTFQHYGPAPVVSISRAEPEFRSLRNPLGMADLSSPSYPNPLLDESTTHDPVLPSGFANEGHFYDFPSADHSPSATTPEALPSPTSSAPPNSSVTIATLHSQNPSEQPNVVLGAISTFDYDQAQAAIDPHSTSAAFHGVEGHGGTLPALPTPLSTPSPAPDPSDTDYVCQCVTDGQTCNVSVRGNTRAVRDHLKLDHAFRSVGKDVVACFWAGCGSLLQRENIPRHILTRHFRVRVNCEECGLWLSRPDVRFSHARVCPARRRTASLLSSSANAR